MSKTLTITFLVGMSKAIYENIIIAVFTPTCICRETQCILGWNFLFKHFSLSSLVLERSERGNENWNLKPTAIGYSLSFNSSQSTAAYMRFFGLITFFSPLFNVISQHEHKRQHARARVTEINFESCFYDFHFFFRLCLFFFVYTIW